METIVLNNKRKVAKRKTMFKKKKYIKISSRKETIVNIQRTTIQIKKRNKIYKHEIIKYKRKP